MYNPANTPNTTVKIQKSLSWKMPLPSLFTKVPPISNIVCITTINHMSFVLAMIVENKPPIKNVYPT